MELILKSDNSSKMAKIVALARQLGINVIQRKSTSKLTKPTLPIGQTISPAELLEAFGKAPDFPSAEEIRSKAWPSHGNI